MAGHQSCTRCSLTTVHALSLSDSHPMHSNPRSHPPTHSSRSQHLHHLVQGPKKGLPHGKGRGGAPPRLSPPPAKPNPFLEQHRPLPRPARQRQQAVVHDAPRALSRAIRSTRSKRRQHSTRSRGEGAGVGDAPPVRRTTKGRPRRKRRVRCWQDIYMCMPASTR
jgi:hypothetical protein